MIGQVAYIDRGGGIKCSVVLLLGVIKTIEVAIFCLKDVVQFTHLLLFINLFELESIVMAVIEDMRIILQSLREGREVDEEVGLRVAG